MHFAQEVNFFWIFGGDISEPFCQLVPFFRFLTEIILGFLPPGNRADVIEAYGQNPAFIREINI